MSNDKEENSAEDEFHNPFSSLKKQLKSNSKSNTAVATGKVAQTGGTTTPSGGKNSQSGGKMASASIIAGGKPQATAQNPKAAMQNIEAEDAEAAAMFLLAMGRSAPRNSSQEVPLEDQSMAELLSASDKKRRSGAVQDSDFSGSNKPADLPHTLPKAPTRSKTLIDLDVTPLELDPEDANSFAAAMQGVKPVDELRGRALMPPAPVAPTPHKSLDPEYFSASSEGKYEFALEYTEDFFAGHVMGLDPLLVAKLRAGNHNPEASLDLHGMNSEMAYVALIDFMRSAYNQGRRNIIIVTGRGKNSPSGLSVLRQNMQDWLTKDPFKRVVLAFCTAQPKDGGAGAIYVVLRKFKKNQGKIRWERELWEDKPLF